MSDESDTNTILILLQIFVDSGVCKVSFAARFRRIVRGNRHPSGVFSYGNSSITLKMMERDGTFLPGQIYRDLGYVSS